MGNCNFQAATATLETEHLTGKHDECARITHFGCFRNAPACEQSRILISLRDWQGWFWQGLEGGAKKGQRDVRDEGNEQSPCAH